MTYGSICSGIEAATVAWHPLGWRPAFFAEIEPFPCSVLKHHYPEVPNLGDFTRIQPGDAGSIDLLVGGTPCQSFSVAGKRLGLDDPRGNLTLEWLALVSRVLPRWLVWENVPGVLSDDGGRTFGAILGTLGQLGYGFAYRVLDAQYFGLAQRRKRVFLVGHLGDWRGPAAVLFEHESLSGHPAPSREAGQVIAPTISARTKGGGGLGTDVDCDGGLIAGQCHGSNVGEMGSLRRGSGSVTGGVPFVVHSATGPLDCDPGSQVIAFNMRGRDGGAQVELAPGNKASLRSGHGGSSRSFVCFDETQITSRENRCNPQPGAPSHPIPAHGRPPAIAPLLECGARTGTSTTDPRAGIGIGEFGDPMFTLQSGKQHGIASASGVRRLTPRECERLMGFWDDYTLVPHRGKPAADGPRYKALGNSMAVPCMRWIGERIAFVDALEAVADVDRAKDLAQKRREKGRVM